MPAIAHTCSCGPGADVEDEVRDDPRREEVDRVVRDVERLHEPRVANAQPLGQVHDDRHQRDQLRRQQEDRREHEDDRRRERVVLERVDGEQLRGRSGGPEDGEDQPALRVHREMREARHDRDSREARTGTPRKHLRALRELVFSRRHRCSYARLVGRRRHRLDRRMCAAARWNLSR